MSFNIVFMGTPDFATPCLEILQGNDYHISGVFTQPDRQRGRGKRVSFSHVKNRAIELELSVFQPENINSASGVEQLKALSPDLIVAVAYGQILSKEVLQIPKIGCINVHASLLPALRGAAPIQWSILNGDTKTGVTTMFLDEGMDTGDMILQRETPIHPKETGGELFDRLAPMGAELLKETVNLIKNGNAPRQPQDASKATYAPMLKKEIGEIDFSRSATELFHLVRGLNPWPSAYSFYNEHRVIFHQVEVVEGAGTPGKVIDAKDLVIACGKDALRIVEIQPQGGKRVSGRDFANGRRLVGGEMFISPSYSV